MTDLNDLVQQLAYPHEISVTLLGQHIGHRPQRPLLDLLTDTSTPSTGSAAGRSAAGPRIAFDPAAHELHTAIRRRLYRWAVDAEVPRHWALHDGTTVDWRNPTSLLRAWHPRVHHHDPTRFTPTLHGWTSAITALVADPDKRLPLDAACPHCNQRWTLDSDGIRIDALQITLRDPATDTETTCRNCGAHWAGLDGAEHLADLIQGNDQAAHLLNQRAAS